MGTKQNDLFLKLATVIIFVFVGAVAVAGLYYTVKSVVNRNVEHAVDWKAVSWRAQLALRKATGNVPDLSWAELWEIMRQRGGFSLEDIFNNGVTLDAALANPFTETKDIEIGKHIFRENCALCHGADGIGLHGPPLNRPGYNHGDSDLSVYKVLRDGVRNTEMVATNLSFVERWQVIGYLRSLQLKVASSDQVTSPPNIPKVTSQQIEAYGNTSGEWFTYSGELSGWRYSSLAEITPANVSKLRVRWIRQFRSGDLSLNQLRLWLAAPCS